MKLKFWGVRGSIPTPLTGKDLKKNKNFTYGGNTSCVELDIDTKQRIIFDGGSGLRELGNNVKAANHHIVLSHLHWDHIQGIPFFKPLYRPDAVINFYHPKKIKEYIELQMSEPFFPVSFDDTLSKKKFVRLKQAYEIFPGTKMNYLKLPHPNTSYSYSVIHNGKKIVYMTDFELQPNVSSRLLSKINEHLKDADVAILDSQYSFYDTLHSKMDWGHSSGLVDIDLCLKSGVKQLVFFHHDPDSSDENIRFFEMNNKKYLERMMKSYHTPLEIISAYEGLEIKI